MAPEFEATTSAEKVKERGVYRTSFGNRWFSSIRRGGKLHYLGTFGSPEDAADAYRRAAEVLDRSLD